MNKVTAHDVAKYIIAEFHEAEDFITNMKVQKLLYYVQGWHLGLYGVPVFNEQFQAWVHGPVQYEVYHEYKNYRWNPISEPIEKPKFEPALIKAHSRSSACLRRRNRIYVRDTHSSGVAMDRSQR